MCRPRQPPSLATLAWLLCAALPAARASGSAAEKPSEYEVKSAFLFHFARLTEWPAAAMPPGQPFVVAVVGQDPFGTALDRVLEGQMVQGRPLVVRRAAALEALPERPHIVFVGTDREDAARVLRHFDGQPVLTVGEIDGFGDMGGIVNFFVTADGRVRFEINVRQADAGGLRMSSQVLKLARIVGPSP